MQLSLKSPGFLLLSIVAILLVGGLRGRFREFAFLALNLTFLTVLLLGPLGTLTTLAFALLGYALIVEARSFSATAVMWGIGGLTILFVYMQRYDFLSWVLPDPALTSVLRTVGLSFLFFKIIHVIVDSRNPGFGSLDLLTYLNYTLNFTAFAMGPIQRIQDYREQWSGERLPAPLTFEAHFDAVLRVIVGIFKAYVLGTWFAERALGPESDLLGISLQGALVQIYCFWFYLYLNFAGYCDVVIGVGTLMGVRPPENFDKPFLANNISDFWQRQHRSLTLWLTDYVFTPTYKSMLQSSKWNRYPLLTVNLALMATMLVSGLWHGTTVSFLLFGVVHGLWFVIYRSWDTVVTKRLGKRRVRELRTLWPVRAGGILLTFHATAIAFVFFRLDPGQVNELLSNLLTP